MKSPQKFYFCDFWPWPITVDQFIRIENREAVLEGLMAYWLKSSELLPIDENLARRRTFRDNLLRLDPLNLYNSISHLMANFSPACRKYGNTVITKVEVLPYLLVHKNIQPLLNQLTIEELLKVELKLAKILCTYVSESEIKSWVEFAIKSAATVTRMLNCTYPKIIFNIPIEVLENLDEQKDSQESSKLDTLISLLNAIHKTHYEYVHDGVHPLIYASRLLINRNFAVISTQYADYITQIYLKNDSVDKGILKNLSLYKFSCAKYIVSLNLSHRQLLQFARSCPNLLGFFSGYETFMKADRYKLELKKLYAIHYKTADATAKKFYQDNIEIFTVKAVTAVLQKLIFSNNMYQEISDMFQIFEKKHVNKFIEPQSEKLVTTLSLASIIELCESKITENLSYFDLAKTLKKNILESIIVPYKRDGKNLASFKACLIHPMVKKIDQANQSEWLQALWGLARDNDFNIPEDIDIVDYLNFLQTLNDYNLIDALNLFGLQSIIGLFDYVTNLNIPEIIASFCRSISIIDPNTISFDEDRLQAFSSANNQLLQSLTLEQIRQIYKTFDNILEEFATPGCSLDFIINLQFICKFIEEHGITMLLETAANYQSQDGDIYESLAQYLTQETKHTHFQFFSAEPVEQGALEIDAKEDGDELITKPNDPMNFSTPGQ